MSTNRSEREPWLLEATGPSNRNYGPGRDVVNESKNRSTSNTPIAKCFGALPTVQKVPVMY